MEKARELAYPHLSAKYKVYSKWGQDKVMPVEESFDIDIEELEKDRFIVGDPDYCLSKLMPWRTELGVDHILFRTHWSGMPPEVTLDSMALLDAEVVPALRDG